MPRCARCGCPNERQQPDPHGLALCALHNQQFRAGIIGADHDPAKREWDPTETRRMLAELTQPGESLRCVAQRVGISKDAIRGVKNRRYNTVRTRAKEAISEAWADHIYRQRRSKRKESVK